MREKKYNPDTGKDEWVNIGIASAGGYGSGDFHRITRITKANTERVIDRINSFTSEARKERYMRGIKLKNLKVDNLFEYNKLIAKPLKSRAVGKEYREKYLGIENKKKNKYEKYIN